MDAKIGARRAIIKVTGGLVLMIVGLLGLMFGRNLKAITLRVSVIGLSVVCLGGGFYLFVGGLEEMAMGRVGDYQLGCEAVQEMVYENPQEFADGVFAAFRFNPDLRRLKFECPDGSKKFTVYNAKKVVIGVPEKDVVCDDGFKLLSYDG